jgi:hypothetical protein
MCSLCGVIAKEHWAQAGDGARSRVFRAATLGPVLEHFGLSVTVWSGGTYVLRDRKGGTAVVSDLGALWWQAERLAGAPLDPLDPDLLAALEA